MATHSSTLAWKNPMGEEPGGLQSMGSQRDMTERLYLLTYHRMRQNWHLVGREHG